MDMCGIAAIVVKKTELGSAEQDDLKELLHQLTDCMVHRGPDAEGLYVDAGIGLAMKRLSIVGGHEGQQPIWNEDKSLVLICNGEIYNHQDLRAELEANGHTFSTSSDVEVIVHLYEAFGDKCLEHLQGIFAFALWDLAHQRLLVARDRVGVKPLYYAETDSRLLFASEFKALLGDMGVDTRIDANGLGAYHAFRFCPGNDTMVQGIKKLRPAEYLVVQDGKVSSGTYWAPTPMLQKMSAFIPREDKVKRLQKCLIEAVQSQATTAVKSGILLSGGLDSTAILAIHRQSFQEVPDTFTVAFAAPRQYARTHEYTETMQAREIAQRYGSTHSSACYSAQEVLDQLPNIVASLDEPIADPTAIPLWFAVRMARQSGVKVLHSGEGLDELFNGYQVYQQSHWLNALARVPEGIRRMVFSVLSRFELSGRGLLARSLAPVSEWYQGVGSVFSAEEQEMLFQGHILNDLRSSSRPQEYVRDMIFPARDASTLTQMTYFDLLAWLPENTLVKSDKISMAHSVELRVPFLHEGVVDFAMEMDDSDKLRRGVGKWIVREALREVVTPDVLRRPKVGFPIPLTAWMFGEWKDFVLSNLMDANAHTCGMYKRDYVEGLFLVPDKERRRAARQLWTLLSLELWYQYVYTDRSIGKALKTVVCG